MKGLLLKDYYVLKDTLLIQFIILFVIGFAISFESTPSLFIVIFSTTFSLFSVTGIISDKTSKWDMYATTLPLSKVKVIRSKYVLNTLLILIGLVLGIIISLLISIFSGELDFNIMLQYILIALIISLSSASISIPLSHVFDDKKQIIVILLSILIPISVFALAIYVASQFIEMKENMMPIIYSMASISIIMFITSWIIAPKLLIKKDI